MQSQSCEQLFFYGSSVWTSRQTNDPIFRAVILSDAPSSMYEKPSFWIGCELLIFCITDTVSSLLYTSLPWKKKSVELKKMKANASLRLTPIVWHYIWSSQVWWCILYPARDMKLFSIHRSINTKPNAAISLMDWSDLLQEIFNMYQSLLKWNER